MHIAYRPHKSAYEATLHKYEHRTDQEAYDKAAEAWRLDRNAPGSDRSVPFPDRDSFNYVMEYNITGDNLTFFSQDYPTPEKTIPSAYKGRRLNDEELCAASLTPDNHDKGCRYVQAAAFKRLGYHGPIGGGEARGLRNLFTEMGEANLVRRGYIMVNKSILRPPTQYAVRQARWQNVSVPPNRRVKVDMLQYCYVFKSPIPSVPFEKFVKLARMYKSDKGGLRRAVVAVLANPEAHKEVETIDALDILSKMVGMDG